RSSCCRWLISPADHHPFGRASTASLPTPRSPPLPSHFKSINLRALGTLSSLPSVESSSHQSHAANRRPIQSGHLTRKKGSVTKRYRLSDGIFFKMLFSLQSSQPNSTSRPPF